MSGANTVEVVKRRASTLFRWFLVAWFCFTLPVVALLAVNEYARFILSEMANHYVSKFAHLKYVFIGDSIGAEGGNWGWRISGNPFTSRNLCCSGYTVHQVRLLSDRALAYHPRWVFVMAGSNDILDENYDLERMLREYRLMLDELERGEAKPVVTLAPHTAKGEHAAEINAFNAALRQLCAEQSVPVVDLNPVIAPDGKLLPQFTTDGIHFTKAALVIWVSQIRRVIAG
jgi:lysophospholipase L1-like esterase